MKVLVIINLEKLISIIGEAHMVVYVKKIKNLFCIVSFEDSREKVHNEFFDMRKAYVNAKLFASINDADFKGIKT